MASGPDYLGCLEALFWIERKTERFAAPQRHPGLTMKAREIIALVLIIAAGIFFTHLKTGKLRFDLEDYVAFDWNAYTFEESGEIESPFPSVLNIINAHGSVEIEGVTGDKFTFTLKKKIWRRNEEKARQVALSLHPVIKRDGSTLYLSTNREEFKKRNFETSFLITCPENIEVKVRNSYGPVKIQRVGKSSIANRHGQVVARDIRGELSIENNHEAVELENIHSSCQLKSRHSDVTAKQVEGEMAIETSYAKIELQDIAQKVAIQAPHTSITGEDLPGAVEIENSYEKISLKRTGPVDIQTRHSPVDIEEANGDLRVRNDYGRVRLVGIRGNIWISGKNLAISGRSVVGQEIYLSASYEEVELMHFSGKATVLVSHGQLLLSPLPLIAPIEVRCDYTPIHFYWPSGENYPFEARTKYGDIRWMLPSEIQVNEENNLTTAKAYAELIEKPRIFLSTTYSDIRVEAGLAR